ncbi:MAG: TlpA disulfide reductase family protein [Candidatus Caldarchaeum sp.]
MPQKKQKPKPRKSYGIYLALIPAALLVAFIIYLVVTPPAANIVSPTPTSGQTTVRPGETAKPFSLNLIDSTGLRNEKLNFEPSTGKVVFIDFLHEWCGFCRRMAPVIDRLHENYRDRGVMFLTVAGGYNTNTEKTAAYLREHGVDWQVVYDQNLDVFRLYGVRGTPTYFVISPDGKIITKLEGEQSYEILANEIEKALRQ